MAGTHLSGKLRESSKYLVLFFNSFGLMHLGTETKMEIRRGRENTMCNKKSLFVILKDFEARVARSRIVLSAAALALLIPIAATNLPAQTAPANHTPYYTPTLFESGQGVQTVWGLAVDNAGYINTLSAQGGSVVLGKLPPLTGNLGGIGSVGGIKLSTTFNKWMAADGLGALYIADGSDIVYKTTNGGTLVQVVGNKDPGGVAIVPIGVAVDRSGQNIYINDGQSFMIRSVNLATGAFNFALSVRTGTSIGSMAMDAQGYLYVFVNQQIYRLLPGVSDAVLVAGGGSNIGDGPASSENFGVGATLAVNTSPSANDHGIYVADWVNGRIYRIDYANLATDGYVTTIYQGALSHLAPIAVDGAGRVFFVTADNSVWQLNPSHPITSVVASLPADFNDGTLVAEAFLDTRVSYPTTQFPAIQALPFVGNQSMINGDITNTGPTFEASGGYPWALLDTARNVVLLHPAVGVGAGGADFAYCPTVASSYRLQGSFARANDSPNGYGVNVEVFKNSNSGNPLFIDVLPPSSTVNPANYFGEPGATSFDTTVSLVSGDCVRFAVFAIPATDNSFDATALQFTVTSEPSTNSVVTIATDPSGLQVTIDGSRYTAPASFNWVAGGSHTLQASSQTAPGAQYNYVNWSDLQTQSSHVIWVPTPPAAPYTITANFNAFYQLNYTVSGAGTVTPGGGFGPPGLYAANSVGTLMAAPYSGSQFTNWTSAGAAYSTTNPLLITLLAPLTLTANFTAVTSPPVINSFTADSTTIQSGGSATLRWTVSNATTVSLNNGIGTLPAGTTSYTVKPSATSTYTLTATGIGANATASVTITVTPLSTVNVTSVGNGASFDQTFASGMLMSVFGTALSTGSPQTVTATPLPLTSSSGTTVTINGIAAPLLYISATQINLQIPYEVTAGSASLIVKSGGQSGSISFTVQAAAPGIFVDSSNKHIVPNESAAAGSTIGFYVTGAGQVTPAEATGNVPSSTATPVPNLTVTVTVGGVTAPLLYVGIPSWSVGTLQINFTVPTSVPAGTQPVVVKIGGFTSQTAYLDVANSNSAAPVIASFTASPSSIQSGQSATLSWTVSNPTSLSIDNGIGTVTGTSRSVSPTSTTTYKLTATNASGTVTATTTVTVSSPSPSGIHTGSFSGSNTFVGPSGQTLATGQWTITITNNNDATYPFHVTGTVTMVNVCNCGLGYADGPSTQTDAWVSYVTPVGICCAFGIGDSTGIYTLSGGQTRTFTVNDYIEMSATQIVAVAPNLFNFDDWSKAASTGVIKSTNPLDYGNCTSNLPSLDAARVAQ